ncbi:hypothetical protein BDB00DRAFT_290895 [Zychaea mexicana]|uniref:uncharacterized protein n=1 Tax=Zychaea mexicana TaxID=64656 RepID=UPI0022FE1C7B|nr:uncharacterized protein BDB00DRAFT_290895 [Zychaea mexicana]KAI9494795.1 hypothetical protein BDB00DRAFT_290895 [Zychaea mexicana]
MTRRCYSNQKGSEPFQVLSLRSGTAMFAIRTETQEEKKIFSDSYPFWSVRAPPKAYISRHTHKRTTQFLSILFVGLLFFFLTCFFFLLLLAIAFSPNSFFTSAESNDSSIVYQAFRHCTSSPPFPPRLIVDIVITKRDSDKAKDIPESV